MRSSHRQFVLHYIYIYIYIHTISKRLKNLGTLIAYEKFSQAIFFMLYIYIYIYIHTHTISKRLKNLGTLVAYEKFS